MRLPADVDMRYDMACFCRRMNRVEDARQWLEKAFAVGDSKELKLKALDDPDLEPLWREIGKG